MTTESINSFKVSKLIGEEVRKVFQKHLPNSIVACIFKTKDNHFDIIGNAGREEIKYFLEEILKSDHYAEQKGETKGKLIDFPKKEIDDTK